MSSQVCWPSTASRISAGGANQMKPGSKNEMAGKVHEVKGKFREMVGQMTNVPDLEAKVLPKR
jgi:hypothetical protein